MNAPYYQDDSVTLHHGDAGVVAHELPSGSADCIVTSPPYFGLRDYGVDGQYGLEATPAEYIETMRTLFSELRRVLTDDGTLWLNIGDSYTGGGGYAPNAPSNRAGSKASTSHGLITGGINVAGLPAKNLLGMPWRVAIALQDDGWILRNAIVWNKPNAMPESVTDRLSTRYELVFLFSKSRTYWFDLDPIREQYDGDRGLSRRSHSTANKPNTVRTTWPPVGGTRGSDGRIGASARRATQGAQTSPEPVGRNPGDVWTLPTQPFTAAHFAVMPTALAERCVQAGCKPGGTVLDPFSGSGTTGLAAARHGRKYVGIDLNVEYLALSLRTRLTQPGIDFDAEVS